MAGSGTDREIVVELNYYGMKVWQSFRLTYVVWALGLRISKERFCGKV